MRIDAEGKQILEIDNRLLTIWPKEDQQQQLTEEEFKSILKSYKLDDAIEHLGIISRRVFNNDYPKEYSRLSRGGVRHPSGILITQFAIEYLANIFLISGSNNWKSASIKYKDNLLGLFNVYHNAVVEKVKEKFSMISLLVPMYFKQFLSQLDPKDLFSRQYYLYYKIAQRKPERSEEFNAIFLENTGLTILEYTKLSLSFFAIAVHHQRFNIGALSGSTATGLDDVLTEEKVGNFLNIISIDYAGFRELDAKLNKNLEPEHTKSRFNPLWLRPVIKINNTDYVIPSVSALTTSTFKGIFWWFDNYFRNISHKKQVEFRKYFSELFEEYVGDVLKDIYGEENVRPQIPFGSTHSPKLFFDWIVVDNDKILLFEAKAYQFPLEVLQKGNPDKVRAEVVNKIVETIMQMYDRVKDIESNEELAEFRNKTLVPIAVFYDIPFISGPLYEEHIVPALNDLNVKRPGIKDFSYYMMGIDEIEDYKYISKLEKLDVLLEKVKNNHQDSFTSELHKIHSQDPSVSENILDRTFNEYFPSVGIPVDDSSNQ